MRVKRTGILTKIVIMVLLVYGVVSLVWLNSREAKAREDLAEKRRYDAQLAAEVDELEYEIAHSDDPEVKEKIARDDGYVYPDEEIIS